MAIVVQCGRREDESNRHPRRVANRTEIDLDRLLVGLGAGQVNPMRPPWMLVLGTGVPVAQLRRPVRDRRLSEN